MTTLKILSWNIQQGGGSRLLKICAALTAQNFDIIVLSEFKNNTNGAYFQKHLQKFGFVHQNTTFAKAEQNSVLIASKHSSKTAHYPTADPLFAENIITAQYSAFNLMGVYLPHKKKNTLLPFITNEVAQNPMPFVIVGDFNTGHNFIDQKGDSFWYQKELKDFENTGFVDAFRVKNGKLLDYSWYSHQGNGYRYDHSYVHENLVPLIKNCYYLHNWREAKLSDHSPMVLELG